MVSSYAPTLRAPARAPGPGAGRAARFLLFSVPEAPGTPPPPGADAEAGLLPRILPDALLLYGVRASRDAVSQARDRHPCHALAVGGPCPHRTVNALT
ncbi:hypothetical protein DVK44_20090 [Streptomyces paludis]|uniref:Uncharacterized protein n=1 Tax=Streptomyces paludis TaxID=2282738 RepID=A0A345HS95_9ACTN|nr:hypothetical protein DVK44_20090 [Streptomyces paludis]